MDSKSNPKIGDNIGQDAIPVIITLVAAGSPSNLATDPDTVVIFDFQKADGSRMRLFTPVEAAREVQTGLEKVFAHLSKARAEAN